MVSTTKKVEPKVFTSLQFGRAIAALIVLLRHCATTMAEPKYWNHSWLRYVHFGHSGVEIFFVLSGIVILYAHWDDLGKPARVGRYAWKRVKRIYPIYWVALAITLIPIILVSSFGKGYERQPIVILQSVLLLHLFTTKSVLGVAWTLYHEIMFYAVFACVILSRRWGGVLLSLWMAASVYAIISPVANPVLAEYISPLHLLFGIGMCAVWFMRRKTAQGVPLLVVGLLGFIACSAYDTIMLTDNVDLLNVGYGASAALMLCGGMFLEKEGRLHVPALWKLLGDASYSIYLIHLVVVSVLAKVLFSLWKHVHTPMIFSYSIIVIGAMVAGVGFHLYVEKPLLRLVNGGNLFQRERRPVNGVRPAMEQSARKAV
jgi:exopolysaccharide production protein ExoZ